MRNIDRLTAENTSGIDTRHRKRVESMLAVEEMLDSLIQELEAAGILDNTYLFFASDNGWLGGEHRIPIGKVYPYEESIRIPLFVRGPDTSPGSKVEELVLNTDLAPTFADLAGVGTFPGGWSLSGAAPAQRGFLVASIHPVDRVSQPGFGGPLAYKAVRTRIHKYVRYINEESELYDLEADPYQLESRHADPAYGPLRRRLAERLRSLRGCAGSSCRMSARGAR